MWQAGGLATNRKERRVIEMAEATNTIIGTQKRAVSDGTQIRKETKASRKMLLLTFTSIIMVGAIIYWGYQIFGSGLPHNSPDSVVGNPSTVRILTHGEIIAPVGTWSKWTNVLDIDCIYWQGANPTGNRFKVQYVDQRGDIVWYDGTPLTEMRGVRFQSFSGTPEKVIFRIVSKNSGQC